MKTPTTIGAAVGRAALLTAALILAPLVSVPAAAQPAAMDYALQPRQIAPDTWVLVGAREDFNRRNGGNIVNTAFVATGDGVIVIDSGPTRLYGEQLRAAIARVTAEPVRELWLTHHHPDHALGNQAFDGTPILALEATREALANEGGAFLNNVFRMTGDWAKGTVLVLPTGRLAPGPRTVGRHRFRIHALAGHTAGDLAILDETTGVLFAGDLVFHDRAPTTPHADLAGWLAALDALERLPARVLVPGHGEPVEGRRVGAPIAQTRAWLVWLDGLLREAAASGLDASEVAARPLPAEFATMPLARHELVRSLAHLFRTLETGALR